MQEFILDPKIFIHNPYWDCPKCGAKESYGVLTIGGNGYSRRCKECWFTMGYKLPELNKKIIYVDQFVISNMEKFLNPNIPKRQKDRIDIFWLELFKTLDTLTKMQLVICPDSIIHQHESMLTVDHYAPLKRMYELLSHGTSFFHYETIQRFQLCEQARNWITGNPNKQIVIDIDEIIHGQINKWNDRLIISVGAANIEEDIAFLKNRKQTTQKSMNELFKNWQQNDQFDFKEQCDLELSSYGQTIVNSYCGYLKDFLQLSFGLTDDITKITNTNVPVIVHSIQEIFMEEGLNAEESLNKIGEFFRSSSLENIPFLKISTLLYAALARKAATGQRRIPSGSFFNDVTTISTLMPYCDAMFIDNECAALLKEEPLKTKIDYKAEIFSMATKEKFLEYLKSIKDSASQEYIDKIKEVYGETWLQPYTTLYINEK